MVEPVVVEKQPLKLGEVLVQAGLLHSGDVVEAAQVSRRLKVPIGRVLLASNCIREDLLQAALEAQILLRDDRLKMDLAAEALKLVRDRDTTFEEALFELNWIGTYNGELGNLAELLIDSNIVTEEQLDIARTTGSSEQLPLGSALVLEGLLSAKFFPTITQIQEKVIAGELSRREATAQLRSAFMLWVKAEESVSDRKGMRKLLPSEEANLQEWAADLNTDLSVTFDTSPFGIPENLFGPVEAPFRPVEAPFAPNQALRKQSNHTQTTPKSGNNEKPTKQKVHTEAREANDRTEPAQKESAWADSLHVAGVPAEPSRKTDVKNTQKTDYSAESTEEQGSGNGSEESDATNTESSLNQSAAAESNRTIANRSESTPDACESEPTHKRDVTLLDLLTKAGVVEKQRVQIAFAQLLHDPELFGSLLVALELIDEQTLNYAQRSHALLKKKLINSEQAVNMLRDALCELEDNAAELDPLTSAEQSKLDVTDETTRFSEERLERSIIERAEQYGKQETERGTRQHVDNTLLASEDKAKRSRTIGGAAILAAGIAGFAAAAFSSKRS